MRAAMSDPRNRLLVSFENLSRMNDWARRGSTEETSTSYRSLARLERVTLFGIRFMRGIDLHLTYAEKTIAP